MVSTNTQKFHYLFKHILKAVEILVTYPGDIRDRLTYAGEELLLIPESAVPEDIKPLFMEIKSYLTKYKAEEGGREPFAHNDIRVTMARRRTSTATPIAKKYGSFIIGAIISLFQILIKHNKAFKTRTYLSWASSLRPVVLFNFVLNLGSVLLNRQAL